MSMQYKGFTAVVSCGEDDDGFFGMVLGTAEPVAFEGQSVATVMAAFHAAVDAYLLRTTGSVSARQQPVLPIEPIWCA